jgi:hypothetical protein
MVLFFVVTAIGRALRLTSVTARKFSTSSRKL